MRSRAAIGRIAAAALAVLAAACQPVPHPFAPEPDAPANPLVEIKDSGGVAVLDLSGAPGPTAAAFVPALIKALLARDITAAFSAGNRLSLFVYGEASARAAGGDRLDVELVWHLVDPTAREIGRQAVRASPTRAAWEAGDPALVARLADQAAEGIATAIRGGAPNAPSPAAAPRTVFIGPPEGGSGLDGEPLSDAVADALRARSIRIARRPGPDDLVLKVALTLGPPVGEQRRLRVAWRLAAPDGKVLGRMEQENDVDREMLGPAWPRLAGIIATAAAEELVGLIERDAPPVGGRTRP